MRGLVTAYSPFMGRNLNQSQMVLDELRKSDELPSGWHLQTWPVVLPTVQGLVKSVLAEPRLGYWLALGEGARQGAPRLETRAHNHFDLRHDASAAGIGPLEGTLHTAGPPSLAAHWPAAKLAEHLRQKEFSIDLSADAGCHCCNALLYLGTLHAQQLATRPWVGFLHLPRQEDEVGRQAKLVKEVIHWLNAQFL